MLNIQCLYLKNFSNMSIKNIVKTIINKVIRNASCHNRFKRCLL